jgi:hypothetical protein
MLHIKAGFWLHKVKWKLREANKSGAFYEYVTLFITQDLSVRKRIVRETKINGSEKVRQSLYAPRETLRVSRGSGLQISRRLAH